ncbi:MAG TPA: MBL fold metallo-hydrolase, partial [Candidatus Sulfotelmatobacter sp.]|nr:MBL fold metallo-hydrolase [Candidatus Sulfotelmatobacter sp.]
MAVTLRYLGWSAFEITLEDGRRLVLDPMLTGLAEEGVPPSPTKPEEFDGADFVLVTHAAGDHIGQAFEILGRGQAKLVCDVATRFLALEAGIAASRIYFMAPGVEFAFDRLKIKALPAEHLSFRQIGEGRYISAPPLSYLLTSPGGVRLFLGGDTSITANHRLFGELYRPHVAVLGVGGVDHHGQSFTELYPDEAALVAKWLGVKAAIPIHYRFDEGKRFAAELKRRAPAAKAVLLAPGA